MKTKDEMIYDFMVALASNKALFDLSTDLSMMGVAEEVGMYAECLATEYLSIVNGEKQ